MTLKPGRATAIIREINNCGSIVVADGSRKWRFDVRFEIPTAEGSEFAFQPFWCPDKRLHVEKLFKFAIGVDLPATIRYDSKEFYNLLVRLTNTSLRVKAVAKTRKGFDDLFIMPLAPITKSEAWGAVYDDRFWPDATVLEAFQGMVTTSKKEEAGDEYDIYRDDYSTV